MPKRLVSALQRSQLAPLQSGSAPTTNDRKVDAELAQINLNLLFLLRTVLVQPTRRWHAQFGVPAPIARAVIELDHQHLERLAGCGFALFDARLHDPNVWQHVYQQSSLTLPEQRGTAVLPRTQTSLQRLCMTIFDSVLFFIWHRVQQQPQRAAALFGMHELTNSLFSQMSIWQCQYIACQHSGLLAVRGRQHTFFWHDLLQFAHTGDNQFLRLARSIATQQQVRQLTPQSLARLTRACYTNAD